jgi:uncharacterized membrane protein
LAKSDRLLDKPVAAGDFSRMIMFEGFSVGDLAAFLIFVAAWGGYEWYSVRAAETGSNTSARMNKWRGRWMRSAIARDNRIGDLQIIRALTGNSAFLASTAIFVTAGIAAAIGSADRVVEILNGYAFMAETTRDRFGLKLAIIAFVFVNAFFRLAWSMRLHSNAAVVLGAIPQPEAIEDPSKAEAQAATAAELCNLAAKHYQGGMHAYYFGFAACAWFAHPIALVVAALWVVAILYRREFRSRANAALSGFSD